MALEIQQLTDMINTKMVGMFDLIEKWIPPNSIIKNTILKDIGQEIGHFNQHQTLKSSARHQIKLKPKCRNGSSCWFLKQGKCWFAHSTAEQSNMSATSKKQRVCNVLPNTNIRAVGNNTNKQSPQQVQIQKNQTPAKNSAKTSERKNKQRDKVNRKKKKKKKKLNKRQRKKKKRCKRLRQIVLISQSSRLFVLSFKFMFMQSHILLLPNCCLNILLYSCCLQSGNRDALFFL